MDETVFRLGIATAIGLLVGIERGWKERNEPDGGRTAGIRTFALFGLLGGTFAAVAVALSAPIILAAGFLGFAGVLGWFEMQRAQSRNNLSMTTAVAGLLVFALGGLAVGGDHFAAMAGAAGLAALLASREVLHDRLKRLSWIELRSALLLAVMTLIVLPLLPDRTIDPWGGLNPSEVWVFTVLTASISFFGYIAVKVLGPGRGLIVSGMAGAVISSTAVTVAFGRMAKTGGNNLPLAGAAALAAAVSLLRTTAIVLVLQPKLLVLIAPVTLVAAAVFWAVGLALLSFGQNLAAESTPLRHPFDLAPLLGFALFFAMVSTISAAVVGQFGESSAIVTSALSGAFDSDVAVLSSLRLLETAVPVSVVAQAALAGVGSNTFGRLFMAALVGPPAYWLPLAGASLAALVAGGAVCLAIGLV